MSKASKSTKRRTYRKVTRLKHHRWSQYFHWMQSKAGRTIVLSHLMPDDLADQCRGYGDFTITVEFTPRPSGGGKRGRRAGR